MRGRLCEVIATLGLIAGCGGSASSPVPDKHASVGDTSTPTHAATEENPSDPRTDDSPAGASEGTEPLAGEEPTIELGGSQEYPPPPPPNLTGTVAGRSFAASRIQLNDYGRGMESLSLFERPFAEGADPCRPQPGELEQLVVTIEHVGHGESRFFARGAQIHDGEPVLISVHDHGKKTTLQNPKLSLLIDHLDADARSFAGKFDLRGRGTKLQGELAGRWCASGLADPTPPPVVNGVPWSAGEPPAPTSLPAQPVAGVLESKAFRPAHVNINYVGRHAGYSIGFFEHAPEDPCTVMGFSDAGFEVATGASEFDEGLEIRQGRQLLDPNSPAAGVHRPADEAGTMRVGTADRMSLRIDAIEADRVRGRVYVAMFDRHRAILAGAFSARRCTKAPVPR